ncbi:protein-disulfide reductase DsbD [Paraburkholderia fungorum]|jgi:thiol:disulfide interchange protein DsbD|uniref:Cytochrome C biogenesis transmembrane region family protein n=2 Tax=Paraburkholderia fungorum TaxID=134537 RepID=A0AAW3V590_9BURK|nr:protein-disulfide reductase DsbD [Paraburkholderia fungorum]AJZ56237.1 cytochrome C biogenesis transmembrane region family protein [Paraburkholderia fungorum]MBB4516510.1 thiol:disulfide interchange protein DsbD [Paraburkholderia fungorum]MBB5545233.1 thiol:disulfide interchange protein DsbD [Paraburkholderia fungorum]MBB6205017.1 thiol:disulfide interchange protein DsbD [Paraburkholderia fungorum]MBU7440629.1 protein-disulfide reductase DsbD [Paraburkholderia fungorum]
MRMTSSSTRRGTRCLAETLNPALRMVLALLFVFTAFAAHAVNESDLLSPADAFPLIVSLSGPQQVTLDFGTKPGYYLYRDRFSFAVDGAPVKPTGMPPSESKNDPTFGVVQVYHRPVQLQLPLPRVIASGIVLSVTAQGCADLGVCYPPLTRTYRIAADGTVTAIAHDGNAAATTGSGESTVTGENRWFAAFSLNLRPVNGLGVPELLGFLLAGLLMAGTVCMYPLIPIVTAVIGGGREPPHRWRGFVLSLAYVQGLALTYAMAGTVAALAGIPLVALTQKPWLLASFGVLMVLFALAMFGVFRLQLPASAQTRLAEWSRRLPGGRIVPAFVMGMLSALIVGPCSTPALAGALLYIANSRDVTGGTLALYVMGAGMGLPLLLVGTFGAHVLPRSGRWMVAVQNTLGVMLLTAALWFVYSLLPDWLLMVLVALLLAGCGMMLRAIDPLPPEASGVLRTGKALGVLLLVAAIAEVVGVGSGNLDVLQPLRSITSGATTAKASVARFEPIQSTDELDRALEAAHGQPVMVDFYADWCITCKELERFTFSDPRVVSEFAHWKLLRIDVTKNSPADAAMLRRYGLFGPPAMIFYDRNGQQQDDARLVGFVGADAFLAHLKRWER